ncbi:DUF4231 domain-containing protein [Promicromonospora sp. NPDC050880]|uniref:DUF4231 domain-containing protein n=1 Tax=Promicromonospora sp. NPDC050880 TaxID=3364406 RepID=UPI0037A3C305
MEAPSDLSERRDRAFERWHDLQRNWRRRARLNKAATIVLTYASVGLAAAAAVLATVGSSPGWVVAVTSGGSALATAVLASVRSRDQWTSARFVQMRLHTERFLYEQQAGDYARPELPSDEARLRLFAERISEIALSGHDAWAAIVESGDLDGSNALKAGPQV